MNEIVKKRIAWIDIAKALGIFLIVFGHLMRGGRIYSVSYAFSVPLFFIISGLVFNKHNQKEYIKDKFFKIIVPYFIISLVSILIYSIIGKYASKALYSNINDFSIKNNIIYGLIYGNSRYGYMTWNTPLWFLPAYFVSLLLINSFESIIDKKENKPSLRICYIVICLLITFLYSKYLFDICLPWYIEGCFILSSYVEIGILLKEIVIKLSNNKYLLLIGFICVVVGLIIITINGGCDIRRFVFGKSIVLYYIGSIILSFFVFIVSMLINKSKILELVGNNSFGIMCLHKFPVLFFQTVLPFTRSIFSVYNDSLITNILGIMLSIISIILCILVIYVIMQIFPYALGKNKRYNIFKVTNEKEGIK